jgi:AAA15 family ATPase/GTPase
VIVSHGVQMIVSFSVSNFRSFSSEETFSLSASNRLSGSHDAHAMSIPDSDQKVLRAGVLYGANGAGKSNLFKALRYLKSVALNRRERGSGTGREAFRLSGTSNEPSSFDIQFIVADKLYRFGFKVDDQRISEEWLAQVIDKREKLLYERITDTDGKVTVEALGLKGPNGKLDALATVGGPQNQSFLATVNTTLETSDYGEELGEVLNWFKQGLKLIGPSSSFRQLGRYFANNPSCAEFASSFLKSVSTGVDHLDVSKKEITEEDLRNLLPEGFVSKLLKDVQEEEDGTALVKLSEGNELFIERTAENHFYRITIRSAHESIKGDFVPFDLVEESDGTRRLLNLMPALHSLHTSNTVFVIDEIDRSLHPNLVWEFLDFFLKSCSDCRAQIIVTTQESNLLDLELLRRDEIWFAEKDHTSATRLYSLTDFKVRTDLDIRKHYLQGRFGAVPFLGDLNRLHEKEGQKA